MTTRAKRPLLTIKRASDLLSNKKLTSEKLSLNCLKIARFGDENLHLNAFSHLLSTDDILSQARASDARRRNNNPKSPLDGIPVSIKANIAVNGHPLTAGSRMLGYEKEGGFPCPYDSDVAVRLLRDSGAVLIGLTTMDEFGMGSLGTNVPDGRSAKNALPFLKYLEKQKGVFDDDENDHFLKRFDEDASLSEYDAVPHLSAGGSSSGSAVSVAFGSSLASIGTDTGGSVRLPSAWNSIVGLKPSYGLISRHGVVEYASSMDTVAILANTVSCASTVLDCLKNRSHHPIRDSTAVYFSDRPKPHSKQNDHTRLPLKGIKIGIPSAFAVSECPSPIRTAWQNTVDRFQNEGAAITIVGEELLSSRLIRKSLAAYYVLACAESSSNLSRYDGVRFGMDHHPDPDDDPTQINDSRERQYGKLRAEGFGPEVIRRILCGSAVLSSDRFHTHYESAAKLRASISEAFRDAFRTDNGGVDLMVIPTALSFPGDLTERDAVDGTEAFANDVMTVPISLAGLPAISVPVRDVGGEDGSVSPIGMQIFGPRFSEANVLKAANVLEKMNDDASMSGSL